jgi:prepilin-type N-terminal cleavage/methylation domain-containing protein
MSHSSAPARRSSRSGFTLIELMVSLVMLSIALVSLAKHTGIFLNTVSASTATDVTTVVARP